MYGEGSFLELFEVRVIKAYDNYFIGFSGESWLSGLERLRGISQLLVVCDP